MGSSRRPSDPTKTVLRPGAAASPAPAPVPHDEVLLGRYRVLARRGAGGFGAVCACWDTRLQRRVAIKRLPVRDAQGAGAPTSADEALAEARTACMLAHPNIVTVYDFELEGAYAYLVMEYVDGLDLAELLARVEGGRLTPDECAWVLASVGRALQYAHDNGVLHLDIKPTNIMVDRTGAVKLTDFGMASLASAAGYGGARGGTVGYMPPEQVQGMLVDERADVFALAVVTWQALTGESPFAAPTAAESLRRTLKGPAHPLSRSVHELAGAPEDALARALAPQVTDRTASVADLVDELVPLLGSCQDGAASLRALVGQSEGDDPAQDATWEVRHLPLRVRAPWLWGAVERGAAGLATLVASAALLPSFAGATAEFAWVGAAACCAAAVVWPPLGSALVAAMLCWLVASTSATAASVALAVALAAALAAWWLRLGREEPLATPALLLGACLPEPAAAAGLAGFALDPVPATVTATAGHLLGSLVHVAAQTGFGAEALVAGLAQAWGTPAFWVGVAGSAACGLVSSAVAMRGSVASGVAGQALGLACVVCAQSLVSGMENGGMWGAPNWGVVACAVLCFAIMCMATALRGPLYEDDDVGGS